MNEKQKAFVKVLIILFVLMGLVLIVEKINLNNNKISNIKPVTTPSVNLDPVITFDSKTGWKVYKNDVFQVEYPDRLPDLKFVGTNRFTELDQASNIFQALGTNAYNAFIEIDGPMPNPNNLELSNWLSKYGYNTILFHSESAVPTETSEKMVDKNLVIVLTDTLNLHTNFAAWFSTSEGIFLINYGGVSSDFNQILSTLKFK